MTNRKFWLGILAVALVLGMTVVGCYPDYTDYGYTDHDDRPFLTVSVNIDNYYPVIGETITASYRRNFLNEEVIGTPSWTWYKTSGFSDKTSIGYSNTYTVKQSDVGFWIYVVLEYSGNKGQQSSNKTSSTVIGIPATATVSVSISAKRVLNYDSYSTLPNHYVTITLSLSDGRWNTISYDTAKNWITLSGIPGISSWVSLDSYNKSPSVSNAGRNLVFSYLTRSETTLSISNLTASLNTAQLSTMRSSTNVYNTLTVGTPSQVLVSEWTISQY